MTKRTPADMPDAMSDELVRLYEAVRERQTHDPAGSRTAKLFAAGTKKIAKKVGEEAVEVALDAIAGDREGVIAESADLLYNLSVLWAQLDLRPEDIYAELRRRETLYGVAEKLPKLSVAGGGK
jgi:phosphoribosyl-ATP pyrophosphohydrolase